MDKTATARLPNGQMVQYTFPYTPFMEFVCQRLMTAAEYPVLTFLNPGVIVDVGANVGCTSLMFAGLYPNAQVVAIEPAAEPFGYLTRNTGHLPRVKAFCFGAFDRDGTAALHLGKDGSVANSLAKNAFSDGREESITLRRFSTFLREQGVERISILKLDTEGAELPILQDIAGMLEKVDAIMLEYHSEADRRAIDAMLAPRYMLFSAASPHPHRGTCCYVAKKMVQERTPFDALAIGRMG